VPVSIVLSSVLPGGGAVRRRLLRRRLVARLIRWAGLRAPGAVPRQPGH
jgi:hypothetical protein